MNDAIPVTVFDPADEAAKARAIAEARAQVVLGDTMPLADIARWLASWGTSDELPPPPWKSSLLRPPQPTSPDPQLH